MPTAEAIAPVLSNSQKGLLTSLLCLLCLAFVGLAWYTGQLLLFGVPAVLLLAMVALTDFTPIFWLLLLSLPVSLHIDLSPSLAITAPSELLMAGLMIVWVLLVLIKERAMPKGFMNHVFCLWLGIHLTWTLVTVFFAANKLVALKFFLAKLWFIIPFVFLSGIVLKKWKNIRIAVWCLFVPLLLVAIQTLVRHASYNFSFEMANKTMTPFFPNHVDYAAMIVVFFPLLLVARNWYKRGSVEKSFIDVGLLIFVVAIFFSYTRSAMGTLLLIPVFRLVFKLRLTRIAVAVSLLAILLFSSYLIIDKNYLKYSPDFERTIYHTDFDDHLSATLKGEDVSFMERIHRWVAAVRMSTVNPLTGFGPSNFYENYKTYTVLDFETYVSENEERSTTHNYFLLLLTEQGFIGMIIFGIFIILIFVEGERIYFACRTKRDRDFMMAILVSQLIILFNIMMADLIETDCIGTLFFMNISLMILMDLRNRGMLDEGEDQLAKGQLNSAEI